jgi:fibronectin type 3 domain-containing protein
VVEGIDIVLVMLVFMLVTIIIIPVVIVVTVKCRIRNRKERNPDKGSVDSYHSNNGGKRGALIARVVENGNEVVAYKLDSLVKFGISACSGFKRCSLQVGVATTYLSLL